MSRWNKLREAAEKAADYGVTGRWCRSGSEVYDLDEDGVPDNHVATVWGNRDRYAVARFMAAANPEVVLEMIKELEDEQ